MKSVFDCFKEVPVQNYCVTGYGLDLYYNGPKRITEVNEANAASVQEMDEILNAIPEPLRKNALHHFGPSYQRHPQYSLSIPIRTPDTDQYEEIDRLSEVQKAGGAKAWMLKNTKYRLIKKSDVMLIDALPEVSAIRDNAWIDAWQPYGTVAFVKNGGKIESRMLSINTWFLPIRIKPPVRKMNRELAEVINSEIVRKGLTHVHGILISRPVIYQLVAPWSCVAVYGAKSGVDMKDLVGGD